MCLVLHLFIKKLNNYEPQIVDYIKFILRYDFLIYIKTHEKFKILFRLRKDIPEKIFMNDEEKELWKRFIIVSDLYLNRYYILHKNNFSYLRTDHLFFYFIDKKFKNRIFPKNNIINYCNRNFSYKMTNEDLYKYKIKYLIEKKI